MLTQRDGQTAGTSPAPELEIARLRRAVELRDAVDRITRHDLKAPLSIILQAADLLLDLDNLSADQRRQRIESIRRAGRRMLDMLNIAQDLVQIESGRYTLQPALVDLLAVLAEVQERHRVLVSAQRSAVAILVNDRPAGNADAVVVQGDRLLTFTFLSYLIQNALEASAPGSAVTVRIETQAQIQIAISNVGAVPAAIRDRFFQKFLGDGQPQGPGLGTYFAKLCVEAQGGTVSLDTSQPEATTVRIAMPRPGKAG